MEVAGNVRSYSLSKKPKKHKHKRKEKETFSGRNAVLASTFTYVKKEPVNMFP